MSEPERGARSSGRPKVLVLLKTLGVGGAETLVLNSARCWDRDRYDYRLAYLGGAGDLVGSFRELGVDPVRLAPSGIANDPLGALRLRRLLRRERIDLIHSHLPVPTLFAALARMGTRAGARIPLIATNHSQPEAMRPITQRLAQATWPWTDLIIAVGAQLVGDTERHKRTEVILNGVDLRRFDAPRAAIPGVAEGATVALVLGSLVPRKRPVHTLRVFEQALEALGDRVGEVDPQLVYVGEGPLRGELEAAREASGARDRVHLLGLRHDIPALCARADVVVLLSRGEGLPMALLEGAAARTPLLATAIASVGELVEDGALGYLVEDDEEAADRLARLFADPALRRRLGEAGRARVERDFSLTKNVRAIEALYDELLARGG